MTATSRAAAGDAFFNDADATLQARNFYLNRQFDNVPTGAQTKRDEWAQAFMLRLHSGYTAGAVGFAMEGYGATAIKLDSTAAHAGSNLLPSHYGDTGPGVTAEGYLALKAKAGQAELAVGGMALQSPILASSDVFLLPQWFEGAWLRAPGIGKFDLELGVIHQLNQVNSPDSGEMGLNPGHALNFDFAEGPRQSDRFTIVGATFKPKPGLSLSYHYGELDDLYRQQVVNVVGQRAVAGRADALTLEARYADSGNAGVTNIDNQAWSTRVSYRFDDFKLSAVYQQMSGRTGYPFVDRSNVFLFNFVELNAFNNKDEQSWQLRFDYDFTRWGLPGLSFMTRYISGDDIDLGTGTEGREWERDSDLQYVFQHGVLRNLSFRWRNATVRNNFAADINEHRLIINYTVDLL